MCVSVGWWEYSTGCLCVYTTVCGFWVSRELHTGLGGWDLQDHTDTKRLLGANTHENNSGWYRVKTEFYKGRKVLIMVCVCVCFIACYAVWTSLSTICMFVCLVHVCDVCVMCVAISVVVPQCGAPLCLPHVLSPVPQPSGSVPPCSCSKES